MNQPALLALEDGSVFHGASIGVVGQCSGEVVFNTAMTGYQEILTDPSYFQQIITLTYPHIGNVGTNSEDEESTRVYASGLVIRDLPPRPSNWRAKETVEDYLQRHKVVGIAGIDTRRLTHILREKGAQRGCIMAGESLNAATAIGAARAFPGLEGADLAKAVTTPRPYTWNKGSVHWQGGAPQRESRITTQPVWKVVAYDFGAKGNILRLLIDHGCELTVVPAQTPAAQVLSSKPDGIFLSNGHYRHWRDSECRCPGVWDLSWASIIGPGLRWTYCQDEIRSSWRQSSGAGSGYQKGLDHESKSWICCGSGEFAQDLADNTPLAL